MSYLNIYMKEPKTKSIVNTKIYINNEEYKVTKVSDTWGEAPILLAFIECVNNKMQTKKLLATCKPNLDATKDKDKQWIITITNI